MRRRLFILGAAAVLAAAALLFGGALHSSSPKAGAAAVPPAAVPSGLAPGGSAAQTVQQLQAQLRLNPNDAHSYALLGLAYQQRARETGDPAYYSKSDGVLQKALRLAPNDLLATSGLGSLALSRHRFREALELGRKALRLSPTTARNYGVVGDALVELGHYRDAFRAFDTMASLKPGLASYARVSYGRELLGETAAGIQAMRMAVYAATSEPEPTAWTHWQLGKLYWSTGRVDEAKREYRESLAAFPGYVYALDALAQVEAARGRIGLAISLEQRAVDKIPLPQFVGALGDLYRASGQERPAERQYALIGAIERLLQANGVKTDLETALFDVDHGIRLSDSLALARRAQRERPSIDGDDVLAWALYRNGRCAEALPYSRHALRLGTRDALKFFHRGMIERCLGQRSEGQRWLLRALTLNPHFSLLWAPVARAALR
jgi:tetratricopeptide (TPR) repeat protein